MERGFLSHTIEVVEDTQPFVCFKLHALAAEPAEVGDQVSSHTGEVGAGVLYILFADGNRHILILHNGICPRRFLQQDFIVFLPILVKTVALHRDKNVFLKVKPI